MSTVKHKTQEAYDVDYIYNDETQQLFKWSYNIAHAAEWYHIRFNSTAIILFLFKYSHYIWIVLENKTRNLVLKSEMMAQMFSSKCLNVYVTLIVLKKIKRQKISLKDVL